MKLFDYHEEKRASPRGYWSVHDAVHEQEPEPEPEILVEKEERYVFTDVKVIQWTVMDESKYLWILHEIMYFDSDVRYQLEIAAEGPPCVLRESGLINRELTEGIEFTVEGNELLKSLTLNERRTTVHVTALRSVSNCILRRRDLTPFGYETVDYLYEKNAHDDVWSFNAVVNYKNFEDPSLVGPFYSELLAGHEYRLQSLVLPDGTRQEQIQSLDAQGEVLREWPFADGRFKGEADGHAGTWSWDIRKEGGKIVCKSETARNETRLVMTEYYTLAAMDSRSSKGEEQRSMETEKSEIFYVGLGEKRVLRDGSVLRFIACGHEHVSYGSDEEFAATMALYEIELVTEGRVEQLSLEHDIRYGEISMHPLPNGFILSVLPQSSESELVFTLKEARE